MTVTKHLYLLRHAKSSWDDPGLEDHDRPLAPRGRKAAKLIGAYLARHHTAISLVLCSPAVRTRQTLELVGPPGEVQIEPELYRASSVQLLDRLHRAPETADAVMVIGHNPAIQDLAAGLVGPATDLGARKFPTAALATLTFAGAWPELGWGGAEPAEFLTPRELS
ncbi:MAG: histidine phosphatase family protein [Solirubrobacterales bacterium]|nr:histidine phosphatase family protein [Solirubrobacterales bacterium]